MVPSGIGSMSRVHEQPDADLQLLGAFGTAGGKKRTCMRTRHVPANTRCGGVRTSDVAESSGDTLSADSSQTFSGDA